MELSYNNKSFEVLKNNGHFIVRNKKTGLISTLKVRQGQDVKRLSLSIGKQKIGRTLKKCGFNTQIKVKQKRPPVRWQEPKLTRLVLG